MSGQVFISYRREDSRGAAGRIYDRLELRFGHDRIFMDVDTIEPGMDFVNVIEDTVRKTDIFLVIIGPSWLTITDNAGNRRLDNPNDFVRLEVGNALKRDVLVIPVLIDGAAMPSSIDLPDDLKPLTRRNAIEISHTRFNTDADRLIRAIEKFFEKMEADRNSTEHKVVETPEQISRVQPEPSSPVQGQESVKQINAGRIQAVPEKNKSLKRNLLIGGVIVLVSVCACCAIFWLYGDAILYGLNL